MRRMATITLAGMLLMPAPAAAAAGQEQVEATPRLETVVVTARRREELLQLVPISMSAFSQQELEQRQVRDLAGIQFLAPSLVVATDQTSRSTSLIAMRGQFEPNSVPTVDPAVGVYLDGVYIARITGANLRLLDMERVEVLRGPQGTLFGRNTIGGALSLLTRRPSNRFEGHAEATLGNHARRELAGVVNLPASGGAVAFRVAASHARHDGYGHSTVTGRDLDDDRSDFVRGQLRIAPAGHWQLLLSADHTQFRNGGQLRSLLWTSPSSARVTAASGNPDDDIRRYIAPLARAVPANRSGSVHTEATGTSATVEYAGAGWRLKSITAARRVDGLALDVDQDGTPYDLAAVLRRSDRQEQFSEELQLLGEAINGRLEWVVGLHYFEEKARFDQRFLAFDPVTSRWNENLPAGDVRNDSLAAFAQLVYALSDRWRVTAGLRFNEDGRQLTSRNARRVAGVESCTVDPALLDAPGICRATLPRRRFDYLPWVVGLDYRPAGNALLYAKWSRGHRAGGYNLRGATVANLGTFEPEHVTAVELGARADLLDDRLRLVLALFRSEFDEVQLIQSELVGGTSQFQLFVQNGGEARINGGELELTAVLGRLRLSGSLGIVDAKFTRLKPNVVDATLDSRFRHAPDATVAIAANWTAATTFGRVDLQLDHSWRDDVYFDYDRDSIPQRAFGLWNASARLELAQGGLDLTVWGRNLADKRYFSRALDMGTFVSASLGDPRSYGLTLRYRFGGAGEGPEKTEGNQAPGAGSPEDK